MRFKQDNPPSSSRKFPSGLPNRLMARLFWVAQNRNKITNPTEYCSCWSKCSILVHIPVNYFWHHVILQFYPQHDGASPNSRVRYLVWEVRVACMQAKVRGVQGQVWGAFITSYENCPCSRQSRAYQTHLSVGLCCLGEVSFLKKGRIS